MGDLFILKEACFGLFQSSATEAEVRGTSHTNSTHTPPLPPLPNLTVTRFCWFECECSKQLVPLGSLPSTKFQASTLLLRFARFRSCSRRPHLHLSNPLARPCLSLSLISPVEVRVRDH